jgi:FkbM family methyltransferase
MNIKLTTLTQEIKHFLYVSLQQSFFRKGVKKKINDEEICFPLEYSRYYPKDYETFKQDFINKHASGICVDLGAHIGLYTVLMSRKAEQVIAFEPTDYTRKILEQTLTLNNCNNVDVRSDVVAESTGVIKFYDTGSRISNANSLVPVGKSINLNSLALDDLQLSIDFLKIDIEGAELMALKGAKKLLSSVKYMTIEIHPSLLHKLGQSAEEIFHLLEEYQPRYYFEGKPTSPEKLAQIIDHYEVNISLNGSCVKI